MKHISQYLLMSAIALTLLLTACNSSTRTSPPDIKDTYWPYRGIDTSFSIACGTNDPIFAYDTNAPLDIQEISHSHSLGLTITDLTYASPMGGRVPATLVTSSGDGPFAGLIIQHGMGAGSHPGYRKNNLLEAETYARLGAVVLLIDAPFNRPEHGIYSSMSFTGKDRQEQIQYIVDLRRGVDLLLSMPEVDPQRLAYVGTSGGGAIGGLLAGVEHRLRGYVFVVGDGGIVTHLTGPEDYIWWDYKVKGLREQFIDRMWPIESIHYVGCAAPAALLFQNGTRDTSVPPPDALRYQNAGSEPKTVMWYDSTHNGMLSDSFSDRAEWLNGLIGIGSYKNVLLGIGATMMVWILFIFISLAIIAWDMWRKNALPLGARLLWLLTALILGPLGLVIYLISCRGLKGGNPTDMTSFPGRRALASSAWMVSGNMLGIATLLVVMMKLNVSQYLAIAMIIVVPCCTSLLTFAIANLVSRSDARFKAGFRRPWFTEITSTSLIILIAFPLFVYLPSKVFISLMGPAVPSLVILYIYFMLVAVVGELITYPFHLWMIKRGVIRWGGSIGGHDETIKAMPWKWQVATTSIAFIATVSLLLLLMNSSG